MKKKLLIAGGCSLAGLLLMIVAFIAARGNLAELSTRNVQAVQKEYECSTDIIKIDADITSDNLEIRTDDVEYISVSYYDRPGYNEYEITESGDSLGIRYVDLHPIEVMTIDLDLEDKPVIITVPESFSGKVNISSSSGSIIAESINVSSLDLENTSGGIRINDVDIATDAKLSNTSGGINVENLVCKNLTASNTSGGISIENSNPSSHKNRTYRGISVKEKIADL